MKQKTKLSKPRDKAKKFKNFGNVKMSEPIADEEEQDVAGNNGAWEVEDADQHSVYSDGDLNDNGQSNVDEPESSTTGQPSIKRKFDGEGSKKGGKKSKLNSDITLMRPPTAKEMSRLRETEYLYHSNLFRLQVEEMLKETKAKSTHEILLKKWIEELKTLLLTSKPSKKYVLSKIEWLAALGIELPIEKSTLTDAHCRVLKPTDVKVIGSYASGCFVGPNIKVDVCVEMPKESFVLEDEMNHKYHTKRAIYLSYVAHVIKTSTLSEEMNFVTKDGILNPILELKPSGKLGKSVLVYVHAVPQSDSFELERFAPSSNKIDRSWYFPGEVDEKRKRSATPHYNAAIARDLTLAANEDFRTNLISSNPSIKDGIILLKIWLRQRNLDEGHGSFSGFIMSMYAAYLLQTRKLNSVMSSYQVARNVWNCLAQSDWCTDGISLCQTANAASTPLVHFHKHYEVVFVDVTGALNLCADVAAETFRRVRHESALAIAALDAAYGNSFQSLFLTTKPLVMQSDHLLRIQEPTLATLVKDHSPPEQQMDHSGQVHQIAQTMILEVLRRGLKQRTSHINVELPPADRWPIGSKPPHPSRPLRLGFVLDPTHAFNILEMGPEANLPEAAEFRAFWGALSQLRRFQDGGIAEVVVWGLPNAPINEKKLIPLKMVQHLLATKLGVPKADIVYLADQFELVLKRRQVLPTGFFYGTGENAARQAMASFDLLAKELRMLANFPLDITAVAGTSAALRYTDAFPPIATNHATSLRGGDGVVIRKDCGAATFADDVTGVPAWVAPIEGVIQLGMSTKWPDDLGAVRRIHAAFYTEMCRQLSGNRLATQVYTDHFDVLKDGFVFRLRISNPKELSLLKKTVSQLGVTKYRDNDDSTVLEQQVEHLPKLTGALHGLYLQHSAFGPGCCLAKRWLRSQLLDEPHFPDVCVELLVASLFVQPAPFEPTNQPQTAFFRFLRLLATTNWSTECMILDLNNKMTKEELLEIETKFARERASLPALFIATSFDRTGAVWSKHAPTMQILVRVAYLAKAAIDVLNSSFFPATTPFVNVSPLFVPSTDDYDVVITLNPKINPREQERVPLSRFPPKSRTKIEEYVQQKSEKVPIVGFDPAQCFIEQLRENYGEYALFFHDTYGGLVIGVLWKPSALGVRDFKVAQVNGRKLVEGSKLAVNQAAIVEDFYVIGAGIVENVTLKAEQK